MSTIPEAGTLLETHETHLISPENGEVQDMRELHYRYLDLSRVARMAVEVGADLAPLVESGRSGGLLEKVTALRRQMAFELGLVLPGIRFRVVERQPRNGYGLRLNGIPVANGVVEPDAYLAIPAADRPLDMPGRPAQEPVYGEPAVWIAAGEREAAVAGGAGVYDVASVIAIHLAEVVRSHAAWLIGRQDVRHRLDFVAKEHPDLIAALTTQLGLGEIRGVLVGLLRERVSIRDLVTIFETLCDVSGATRVPLHLLESARLSLAPTICHAYSDNDGVLHAIVLHPSLEQAVLAVVEQLARTEPALAAPSVLDPRIADHLVREVARAFQRAREARVPAALVVSPPNRLYLRRFLETIYPNIPVLAWSEVTSSVGGRPRVQVLATIPPSPDHGKEQTP